MGRRRHLSNLLNFQSPSHPVRTITGPYNDAMMQTGSGASFSRWGTAGQKGSMPGPRSHRGHLELMIPHPAHWPPDRSRGRKVIIGRDMNILIQFSNHCSRRKLKIYEPPMTAAEAVDAWWLVGEKKSRSVSHFSLALCSTCYLTCTNLVKIVSFSILIGK